MLALIYGRMTPIFLMIGLITLGALTGTTGITLGLICFLALGTSLMIFASTTTTGTSFFTSGSGVFTGGAFFTGGTVSVNAILKAGRSAVSTGLPSRAYRVVASKETVSKTMNRLKRY